MSAAGDEMGDHTADELPADAVFFTVPWLPDLGKLPRRQFTGQHMRILDVVEWTIREGAVGLAEMVDILGFSSELVMSTCVMLLSLGRLDSILVTDDDVARFELEGDPALVLWATNVRYQAKEQPS